MEIEVNQATLEEHPVLQNLARFYIYDLSEFQGRRCPENGLFEDEDYIRFWQHPGHFPFLVRCGGELAGFALVEPGGKASGIDQNLAEFFILRKFRHRGVADSAAISIFERFPGRWEVMALANNPPAVGFWDRLVPALTDGQFERTQEHHSVAMVVYRFSNARRQA